MEKLNRHCVSGSGLGVVHVQAPDRIVHNMAMAIVIGCFPGLFYQNVFLQTESTSIMSFNGKGFTIKDYLEVYSLSSDQVFL